MQRALSTACIAVALALVAACNVLPFNPANQLLSTLPTSAAGVDFDDVRVVDDNFLSGHAVDDVLIALGKHRSDGAAVFRFSSVGEVAIGAIVVGGVGGEDLLAACVENWYAPAVIRRSQRAVNGTDGWEIETRGGGQLTVFYLRGNVVYVAWSEQRPVLEAVLAEMP